ncbi:UNVERIFIED_ORG: uncharacterized protein YeaO (DUF488 family) [Microbispora rosea subsp. rosea]
MTLPTESRDVAISTELRRWHDHDPAKFTRSRRRYWP